MGFLKQKEKGCKMPYWTDITIVVSSLSIGCVLLLAVGATEANPLYGFLCLSNELIQLS